jgi:hypothetical protein
MDGAWQMEEKRSGLFGFSIVNQVGSVSARSLGGSLLIISRLAETLDVDLSPGGRTNPS